MYITSRVKMLISCSLISYVASTFPVFASSTELRDVDETFSHKSSTLPSTDTSLSEIKLLEEEVDSIPIPTYTGFLDTLLSGVTTVAKIALNVLGNESNLNGAQGVLLPGNVRCYSDEKGKIIFTNENVPRQQLYSQMSYTLEKPGQPAIPSWIAIPPKKAYDDFPTSFMDPKSIVATSSLANSDISLGEYNGPFDILLRFSIQNAKKSFKYTLTGTLSLGFVLGGAELYKEKSNKKNYNITNIYINMGGQQNITNSNTIPPQNKLHNDLTDTTTSFYAYSGFDELVKNETDNSVVLTLSPIEGEKLSASEIDEMSNFQTRPLNKRELKMLKAHYQV